MKMGPEGPDYINKQGDKKKVWPRRAEKKNGNGERSGKTSGHNNCARGGCGTPAWRYRGRGGM